MKEPKNIKELAYAIKYGKRHDGCLVVEEQNPKKNGVDYEVGDLYQRYLQVKVEHGDTVRVYRKIETVASVDERGAFTSDIDESILWEGSFDELKESPWWGQILDVWASDCVDLSALDEIDMSFDEETGRIDACVPMAMQETNWAGWVHHVGIGHLWLDANVNKGHVCVSVSDGSTGAELSGSLSEVIEDLQLLERVKRVGITVTEDFTVSIPVKPTDEE